MEVHHHPKLEKKNFKEYLLEGFMIFMAVTLGFFAENYREHIKENEQIKNNIESMIGDLNSDIEMFDNNISLNKLADQRIDTLITLLKTDRSNSSQIYFLARWSTANNSIYTPSTKTFDQMKSSGALRLIHSRSVLDSISAYYQWLKFFDNQNNLQREKVGGVHAVNAQLFDGSVFQKMFLRTEANIDVIIARPDNNPPLLTDDFKTINQVIVAYHYLYATTEINTKVAEVSRQNALRLIDYLKKEYDVK